MGRLIYGMSVSLDRFAALDERTGLKVLETWTFGSGVVYLRYEAVNQGG